MGHAVPVSPDFQVFQPEIGGQVDYPCSCGHQLWHHAHGDTMGCCEKNQVTTRQGDNVGHGKRQIVMPSQIGIHICHSKPCFGT